MNNFFMEAGNPWCQNSLGELFEALCVSLPAYLEWVSKRDFDCHQMCSCVLHTGLWPGKAFPVLRQLRSIVEVCCGFLGCSMLFQSVRTSQFPHGSGLTQLLCISEVGPIPGRESWEPPENATCFTLTAHFISFHHILLNISLNISVNCMVLQSTSPMSHTLWSRGALFRPPSNAETFSKNRICSIEKRFPRLFNFWSLECSYFVLNWYCRICIVVVLQPT